MGTIMLNGNRGKMIMNGVVYGNNIRDINDADIYNHGEITGFNPYYWVTSGYKTNSNIITLNDSYIDLPLAGRPSETLVFLFPVDVSIYKKLWVNAEVFADGHGDYADAWIEVYTWQNKDTIKTTPFGQKTTTLVTWGNGGKNYDNTSPWYQLSRQDVLLDFSTLQTDYVLVAAYANDVNWKIYSIWLEP